METKKNESLLFDRRDFKESEKNDYYATPPYVTEMFLNEFLKREGNNLSGKFWEPSCGEGHMSRVLEDYLYDVRSSDLVDRGFGEVLDFLETDENWDGDIITNPPFKYIKQFVEKSLDSIDEGRFAIFLARTQFMETKTRRDLFLENIYSVYVHSARVGCYKNGDSSSEPKGLSYSWFVFKKGYKGNPTLHWL